MTLGDTADRTPIPVWQELKEIAVAVERLPEFIYRPDLNAENIGVLDLLAKKLHELADELSCSGEQDRMHNDRG